MGWQGIPDRLVAPLRHHHARLQLILARTSPTASTQSTTPAGAAQENRTPTSGPREPVRYHCALTAGRPDSYAPHQDTTRDRPDDRAANTGALSWIELPTSPPVYHLRHQGRAAWGGAKRKPGRLELCRASWTCRNRTGPRAYPSTSNHPVTANPTLTQSCVRSGQNNPNSAFCVRRPFTPTCYLKYLYYLRSMNEFTPG